MVLAESPQLSDIQVSRKIKPSESFRRFFRNAIEVGDEVFGYSGAAMHRRIPTELDLIVNPDDEGDSTGLGISSVVPYSLGKLKLTLFEHCVPASPDNNRLLRRLHARLSDEYFTERRRQQVRPGMKKWVTTQRRNQLIVQLQEIEDKFALNDAVVFLGAQALAISSHDSVEHSGVEYALILSKNPATEAYQKQANLIWETARRTAAGSELHVQNNPPANATELPFMRTPIGTSDQHEEFQKRLADYVPVDNLLAGPIRWKLDT